MTKKAKASATSANLEVSLAEISQLVEQMEHNELSLEQSLAAFERGVTLIKHCQKILADAEQKVEILMKQNNGKDQLQPFESDDE